jgi:hypothetical protein
MRKTNSGADSLTSSLASREAWLRLLRASVCTLSLLAASAPLMLAATALASGTALAGDDDDEEDDTPLDQKIIRNVMTGLGAVDPNQKGIDYRERSPLVVPPRLDLPQPETSRKPAANWPKDPDVTERKARKEAERKSYTPVEDWGRPLSANELNVPSDGRARARANTSAERPGDPDDYRPRMMSPSELGSKNVFTKMFSKDKPEVSEFKGEPARDKLTQPPVGYQTPSPNFAYGVGGSDKQQPDANGNIAAPLSPSQMH